MPITTSIFSFLTIRRMSQIDLFRKYPIETQYETLFNLLKKAKDTEYGKKFHFGSIKSIDQYRERVPIIDYEILKSYVIRLRQGEKNLIWSGEIKWFAKSSGTTSDKSKFIPVSKDALEDCHFRGGKDILAIFTQNYPEHEILTGKCLTLGGSRQINNFSNDSYYGDLSAIIIQNIPFWAEFLRTPSQAITLIEEWDEKIEQMALATIKEDVTQIAGVPSWTLVLAKRILEITGKNNLMEVWPNLELFTHGGVSFVPYREQFKKLIPSPKMNYLETYNASEGFFALQDNPLTDDMLLMLDYGIFYEFIPMEDIDKEKPHTVSLEGVEIDKNYAMLISTNGGLWRYLVGDTIKFTSVYPFKIKITGRIKHFINAFGEELIIDNAEKAIRVACEKTNADILEYTAGPIYMGDNQKGGHQWLFEFQKPPENMNYFIETLDNALKAVNSDYEAKRFKNMTLDVPSSVVLKPGVFYEWLKIKGKLGGQHKIPRLANHREYIEEFLEINKKIK
ncbi:MAG: GH3 auxin-responsive promoter family protein [Bacteroidia bacterium]|nr:GH3 auxin-responsive promoter family protein [Bacteroidia bacterium]